MHHDHDHCGCHEHHHDHEHCSCQGHDHHHDHHHGHNCQCGCHSHHAPVDELVALMKYMVGHNAAHARELADLAQKLEEIGNHEAFEQVMAAVSDFEKGNLRLSAVLASLNTK